jgi:hypothetical protein
MHAVAAAYEGSESAKSRWWRDCRLEGRARPALVKTRTTPSSYSTELKIATRRGLDCTRARRRNRESQRPYHVGSDWTSSELQTRMCSLPPLAGNASQRCIHTRGCFPTDAIRGRNPAEKLSDAVLTHKRICHARRTFGCSCRLGSGSWKLKSRLAPALLAHWIVREAPSAAYPSPTDCG